MIRWIMWAGVVGCGTSSREPVTEAPAAVAAPPDAAAAPSPDAGCVIEGLTLPIDAPTGPLAGGKLTRCTPEVVTLRHDTREDVLGAYVTALTERGWQVERRASRASAQRDAYALGVRVFASSQAPVQEVNFLREDPVPREEPVPGEDPTAP